MSQAKDFSVAHKQVREREKHTEPPKGRQQGWAEDRATCKGKPTSLGHPNRLQCPTAAPFSDSA